MEEKAIRFLVVEDDPNLGALVEDFLVLRGHQAFLAADGLAGLHAARQQPFDICLLDVMLPKLDGFELARRLRQERPGLPIIFLTAKGRLSDKAAGFQAGADDYLTKPFSMEELLMRAGAILRRHQPVLPGAAPETLLLGRFSLDLRNRRLENPPEAPRSLSAKEADLLRLLAEHQNRLLPRALALHRVWGADNYYTARSMDVYVSRLRKYLSADPSLRIINVHGSGFMLVVPQPGD